MEANTSAVLTKSDLPKRTYQQTLNQIKQDVGGLESVRNKLKLSRKEICNLLMVDPSAWTRWTDEGGDAPPHIYRALAWYLEIEAMKQAPDKPPAEEGLGGWQKDREINRLKADIQSIRAQFAEITRPMTAAAGESVAPTVPIKNQGRSAWFWLLLGLLGLAGYWLVGMGR